jgi:hypothetical protein
MEDIILKKLEQMQIPVKDLKESIYWLDLNGNMWGVIQMHQ